MGSYLTQGPDAGLDLFEICICAFQICNYQGPARVVVQLVTALTPAPQLHAHSLVGKQCDKGICIADLQPKDSTIRYSRTRRNQKSSPSLRDSEFLFRQFPEPRDPPRDEEERGQDSGGEDDRGLQDGLQLWGLHPPRGRRPSGGGPSPPGAQR